MKKQVVINKGKKYIVNVAGWEDGIGAGFPVGTLLMKSQTDLLWYYIRASGSIGDVSASVNQTASSFPTESYLDNNYPWQILGANDGFSYVVYLSGSAPDAGLVVSQSGFTGSVDAKPYWLLQNINDGNYYYASLINDGGSIVFNVNQLYVSQSYVNSIF